MTFCGANWYSLDIYYVERTFIALAALLSFPKGDIAIIKVFDYSWYIVDVVENRLYSIHAA
jgi:hypothetical protein